jgi:transcriptional regulator with XRE-family HTH domain
MDEDLRGYQSYWLRIARHIGLSEAGKQMGVRASQLSAFERGNAHDLSEEQIAAYVAWLQSIEVPEPVEEDEPVAGSR